VRSTALIVAMAVLASCSANPDKRVAREAAVAMTGSPETITAIAGLTIDGNGSRFDGAPFTVSSFKRTMNFRRGQWRQELARAADGASQIQITGLDGKIAFNIDPAGSPARLSDEEAQQRRAVLYHHPIGFLFAVFSKDAPVSNTRTEDGMEAVDMTIDGVTYSLFIDAATKLPAKIVSKARGDAVMETSFGKYTNVHGYKLPSTITTRLDRRVIAEFKIEQQFAGAEPGNLAAPAALRSATPTSPAEN
jgi:hypothetical protein